MAKLLSTRRHSSLKGSDRQVAIGAVQQQQTAGFELGVDLLKAAKSHLAIHQRKVERFIPRSRPRPRRRGPAARRRSSSARAGVRSELDLGDAAVIGLLGRVLASQKGQDLMIRLMPELRRRRPDAVLVIVGDGPDLETCQRSAAALGLSGAVRFAGYRSAIPDVLAAVDVVVVPSLVDEGFPSSRSKHPRPADRSSPSAAAVWRRSWSMARPG